MGYIGLPWWFSGKESACQYRNCRRRSFDPWVSKICWRRRWQPTSAFLPGKSHSQRSLAGYSPGGHCSLPCKSKQEPSGQQPTFCFGFLGIPLRRLKQSPNTHHLGLTPCLSCTIPCLQEPGTFYLYPQLLVNALLLSSILWN